MENEKTGKAKRVSIGKGKVVMQRKGLPRSNKPISLPENLTRLKQSNIITTMQADYGLLHNRILVTLIDRLQPIINRQINNPMILENLFPEFQNENEIRIVIPLKDFGVAPSNYLQLKQALKDIATIPVEYDTINPYNGKDMWGVRGFFSAEMDKARYHRNVHIILHKKVAEKVVFALNGYTQYYKEIALNAKNKYSPRLYMLISSWREKGGFKIKYERFRAFLGLKDKYKRFYDLYKNVIRPVYEELFEKADVWFEMAEEYENASDSYPSVLNFKVVRGILSEKERQIQENQRKAIRLAWVNQSGMREEQIEKALKFVTSDNYISTLEKTTELIGYIRNNLMKIENIGAYFYRAIMNILCPAVSVDVENDSNNLWDYQETQEGK